MVNLKIFVEGIADEKFIKDYFQEKKNIDLKKNDIITTNGWDSINSSFKSEVIINQMNLNTDNNGYNLLIFDSDLSFNQRLIDIESWKNKNNLEFHVFLWPNNKDNGDFEVLLENIINPDNSSIIDCWNNYENCLDSKQIEGRQTPLTTPARKTKIYAYLEALLGQSKSQKKQIKETNRNYREKKFWNLNSEYLKPFDEFINKNSTE